jgi:hypothetical protein
MIKKFNVGEGRTYVDNLLFADNEESIIELSHRTAGLSVHIAGGTASVEEISGD